MNNHRNAALVVFACTLAMAGCDNKDIIDQTPVIRHGLLQNTREYRKNSIVVVARPIERGKNYCGFYAGEPWEPYNGNPPILLKLPSGKIVNSSTTNALSVLSSEGNLWPAGGSLREIKTGAAVWPTNYVCIRIGSWQFVVGNNKIKAFSVGYNSSTHIDVPSMGCPTNSIFYKFPLTQEQLEVLLGPPDKIVEYFEMGMP